MSNSRSKFALTALASLQPGLGVVVTHGAEFDIMHHAAGWLAQRGRLLVIDGGCAFDANRVMNLIHLESLAYREAMGRIHVSRAFTVYQLMTRLNQTPGGPVPVVMCHPLTLFYDDHIDNGEALRLFHLMMGHIQRLSAQTRVVMSARPPRPGEVETRIRLFQLLCQAADHLITPGPPSERPRQLPLI